MSLQIYCRFVYRKDLKKKKIAIAADCSETFHDCQTRGFKSACKRPESGASRNPPKSERKVEWRSVLLEKKIDLKRRKQNFWNMQLLLMSTNQRANFPIPMCKTFPSGWSTSFSDSKSSSTRMMFQKFDFFKSLYIRRIYSR